MKPGARAEAPGPEDEREQEISGAQFLCETLIRSLTLEEAPDQKPPRRGPQAPRRPLGKTWGPALFTSIPKRARCLSVSSRCLPGAPVLRAVSRDSGLRPERTTEAAERLPGASLDTDAIRVEVLAPPPYPGRPPGRPKEEAGGGQ